MADMNKERQEDLMREALDWLARFSLREASREDLVDLRRWRDQSPAHAAALVRAGELWRGLKVPIADLVRDGTVSVPTARFGRPLPSRRLFVGLGAMSAAAAIATIVVRPPLHLWPSLAELAADYRTGTGEQQHLTLQDGVSIDLNTRTSIALRTIDQESGIELIAGETAISLSGSADRRFVIIAADGRMFASRGSFNIRREGSTVRFTCIDGEASIQCRGQFLQLGSNKQVTYDAHNLGVVDATDPAIVTAWREGVLVFRNTPLSMVIEEVNRYRPGRIILLDDALGTKLVTARFDIKRLDTVIGQISKVFNVRSQSLPGGIVLVG